eukprot:2097892-Amphidinium_carterae.1
MGHNGFARKFVHAPCEGNFAKRTFTTAAVAQRWRRASCRTQVAILMICSSSMKGIVGRPGVGNWLRLSP